MRFQQKKGAKIKLIQVPAFGRLAGKPLMFCFFFWIKGWWKGMGNTNRRVYS